MRYEKSTEITRLAGYSDSDHAGDDDNRKSTSGNLFYLGKCLVSWQSLKQHVVALSSCEAEYVAATTAATQAVWLARLLGELVGKKAERVELMMDSKLALALSENPVFHE
jgi:inactivated superfamily I helicase